MTPKLILAVVLTCGVLAAWVRLILWSRSAAREARGAPWRVAVLLALQPVCAALLFFCLFPPGVRLASGALTIATAGAPASATGARVITLPEAPAIAGAEPAPDLGTALRRHPDTRRITVLGRGLTARDRDAAKGIAIDFEPAPLPRGLAALNGPQRVAPGARFEIGGGLSRLSGATVDLIDPAGRVTDTQKADADGRFILSGTTRSAGLTTFVVRVRSGGRVVEQADVPVQVDDGAAPRLLIMAGAPGPEVKYLRRWATDAGFAVTVRTTAGGGVEIGDAPVAVNSGTLRGFDAAIIDDRSWAGLGAGRAEVLAAVRGGMGLVLRSGGVPEDGAPAQWRSLGFTVSGSGEPVAIALPAATDADIARTRRGIPAPDASSDLDIDEEFLPEIRRLAATPGGDGAVPVVRDAGGATLAAWRALGRGRVAVFTGIDSFGLTLTGRNDLYGDWWGTMLSTVARPAAGAALAFAGPAWVGDRVALCGLATDARVEKPDGTLTTVRVGPGAGRCAGFWPTASGWHLLRTTSAGAGEQVWPFYVQPADRLAGVRAARDRDATLMLRNAGPARSDAAVRSPEVPGSPWPWFFAWLAAAGGLWWFERSGLGRLTARP
ncbi:carboxypeptidase regulatory-like domain-containing protein [Brevundimonas lenta]|uniref:Carboxypeptidase regulatory-like domain-containing protein n=1 Tax=Brevundimonas lenta TaxID=424796 RepID=A0A7W6JG04_9CAUL|nr:carboxypeptidase regulatory-like domain-containing protein [Brevundimonas lenta]MBB4084396.1 hypothetical protein [Brevundimonas lenta]